MEHGGVIVGEAATDNPKSGEAWDIATATMRKFYEEGVTDREIAAAKDYLTGELPLAMTSTDKIASLLVGLQLDRMGIDYLDRRNDMIRAVSADDIERVIRKWFNPDLVTLSMVGKPDGITPTETRALVRE
jgi:zinc protease